MPQTGSEGTGSPPPVNFFPMDFSLRLVLFATSLTGLLLLVVSEQKKAIPVVFPFYGTADYEQSRAFLVPVVAKFEHSSALVYLLAALTVTCLYTAFTLLTTGLAIRSSLPSTKLLFHLALWDALMVGVLAAATGAGGAVAYLALKGNSHVRWNKICNIYDKFCRYIGSAVALSLVSSIVLVALVVLSSYSLYRRSR